MSFFLGLAIGCALGAIFHIWFARQFPSVSGVEAAVKKDMGKL